jgi:hypothetical protein
MLRSFACSRRGLILRSGPKDRVAKEEAWYLTMRSAAS